jgi:Uri superfamily endonuclease
MTSKLGTYVIVLASRTAGRVRVGKLGTFQLRPGFYVYVGSAHGPGGLRARLPRNAPRLRVADFGRPCVYFEWQ